MYTIKCLVSLHKHINYQNFLICFQGLQEEWQRVFYIAAVLNVIGALVFLFFSDVQLQPWAIPMVPSENGDRELQPITNKTIIIPEGIPEEKT